MAKDVTLQIMKMTPGHDLSYDSIKDAARLKKGDIIQVILSTDVATWNVDHYELNDVINSPRTVFVHVTDVPITALNKAFGLTKSQVDFPVDPEVHRIILRRKWQVDIQAIPQDVRDQILADGEGTFTWTQAKSYIKNKPEARNIVDGDLL